MKLRTPLPAASAAAVMLLGTFHAGAAILQWQSAINSGSATASKNFSTVTAPILFDVGALTGDRSFEFIVNASVGVTPSSALLGNFATEGGKQALKFEQWNKTGVFGATAFGLEDYLTSITALGGVNTQVVFRFDGTKTDLYVNGAFKATILTAASANVALGITGQQGLGGWLNGADFVDPMQGSILGFASYDTALSPTEIASHYSAFAAPVPEAGTAALAGLALMGALAPRRRGSSPAMVS